MKFSSKILEELVDSLSALPSIGKKTALRLALHIIQHGEDKSAPIIQSLANLTNLKTCKQCHNFSDHELCHICTDPVRRKSTLCVVESVVDVMAIEDTDQFNGVFHVLGGVINPLEGIGPDELNIDSLIERTASDEIEEVIMAISPTIEGETTIYYLSKQLGPNNVKISQIARGVSFGGELEYADALTLGRSIHSRTPYNISSE